jgi:hypothetical protein
MNCRVWRLWGKASAGTATPAAIKAENFMVNERIEVLSKNMISNLSMPDFSWTI